MKKTNKLKLLTGIVSLFKLSVNDAVAYWVKNGRLNLDASTLLSQVVSPGKYETPKIILPGMYVYADGLIYPKIIEWRQIIAVVGSVTYPEVLAVCLHEACLPWSSDWLEAKATQKMTGGQEATRKILEISRKKRQKAEAAQWCYDYTEDGVKKGEAFLASLDEQKKMIPNVEAINDSLQALGAPLLDGWYWSSTEYSNDHVWRLYMGNGNRNVTNKIYDDYVRPVLKIQR